MKKSLFRRSLASLLGLGLAATVHAARPLNTDDTGVLDKGACEAEAVFSRDRSEGVTVRGRGLQVGCGLGGRTQVALAVDQAREDGLRVRGLAASGKFALLPGDDASWSVGGAVRWTGEEGQRRRHAATEVALLHTRTLGDRFVLHASLGHAQDALARRGATTWGVAIEHTGWGPWALMGELTGDDLAAPSWNVGLRWTAVPDRWVLDIAYGQQLVGGRPKALSMGLKLSF